MAKKVGCYAIKRLYISGGLVLSAMCIYFYGFGSAAADGTGSNLAQIPKFYLSKLGSASTGVFDQSQTKNPYLVYPSSIIFLVSTIGIIITMMVKGHIEKSDFIAIFLVFFLSGLCADKSEKK